MASPYYQVIARYRAREGSADSIASSLRELATASRREPGNVDYLVTQSLEDPLSFVVIESYRSGSDFVEHRTTDHFQSLVVRRILPELEEREVRAFRGTGALE